MIDKYKLANAVKELCPSMPENCSPEIREENEITIILVNERYHWWETETIARKIKGEFPKYPVVYTAYPVIGTPQVFCL